jgi:hypothetical protein
MTKRGSNAARDLEFRGVWCDVIKLRHSRYTRESKTYEKKFKNKNSNCWPEEKLEIDWRHMIKRTVASDDTPERGERLKGEAAMPVLLFVSLCIRQQLDLLASMTSCCTVFLLSCRWSLCVSAEQGDLREALQQT